MAPHSCLILLIGNDDDVGSKTIGANSAKQDQAVQKR